MCIFKILYNHKRRGKEQCEYQIHDGLFFLADLHAANRQCHCNRTGDQNNCINRAQQYVQMFVCIKKHFRVPGPENAVGHKKTAKQQNFG